MADQASYKEINEFIRRELEKHGEWLVDRFVEQIEKNGNIITGNLLDTLNYDLYDPGNGSAAGLEVELPVYGRFFEIAGNKRRQKASKMPKNVNRIVWGISNRPTKRKPTRWYNMNMYKGLGTLVARLSAGITDDELRRIRKVMADNTVEHMKLFWDEKI